MKQIIAFFLIGLFATSALALESPWEQKLPFKSATINYDVSGMSSGSKTLFVKDYGRTSAEYKETSLKVFGMKQEQKEFILTTPDWEYTADLVANTGTKNASMEKYLTLEFNQLSRVDQKKVIKNVEEQGVAMIEGMEGSLEKNAAKILGYSCDKATMMGAVVYTINGTSLPLKIEGSTLGMKFNEVATSIKKGRVDASKFELPSNVNFEYDAETDEQIHAQAKMIIQNLVSGQPATVSETTKSGQNGQATSEKQRNQLTPEQGQQLQNLMKMFGGQGD